MSNSYKRRNSTYSEYECAMLTSSMLLIMGFGPEWLLVVMVCLSHSVTLKNVCYMLECSCTRHIRNIVPTDTHHSSGTRNRDCSMDVSDRILTAEFNRDLASSALTFKLHKNVWLERLDVIVILFSFVSFQLKSTMQHINLQINHDTKE